MKTHAYLDADQAQTLFQSAPQVLQDMVGGESALAEQLATGQVVIPMAEWMAVPRLPNRDEILRNARTTADGLSPAELESLDIEAMARELGVPLDAPAPDSAAASARVQVQQSVMAQLVGTERYTAAQAESQAQLWGAMFGRLGEVTGQDPVALYERYAAGIDAAEAPAEGAESQPRTLCSVELMPCAACSAGRRRPPMAAGSRPSSVRAAPMCSAQASGCWPTIGAKPATS